MSLYGIGLRHPTFYSNYIRKKEGKYSLIRITLPYRIHYWRYLSLREAKLMAAYEITLLYRSLRILLIRNGRIYIGITITQRYLIQ